MPEPDLIQLFVAPLVRARIRYLITGSVAATLYGEPRFTNDIDLVVLLRGLDANRLDSLFPGPEFYVPPPEVILSEIKRPTGGHFNIIHSDSALKADIYLAGQDPFRLWAFEHAVTLSEGETAITAAPPEYVIVRKLQFYREGGSEKHVRDIRGILDVSSARIDTKALTAWIDRLGLEEEWRKVNDRQ